LNKNVINIMPLNAFAWHAYSKYNIKLQSSLILSVYLKMKLSL